MASAEWHTLATLAMSVDSYERLAALVRGVSILELALRRCGLYVQEEEKGLPRAVGEASRAGRLSDARRVTGAVLARNRAVHESLIPTPALTREYIDAVGTGCDELLLSGGIDASGFYQTVAPPLSRPAGRTTSGTLRALGPPSRVKINNRHTSSSYQETLSVQVVDREGYPIAGIPVTFEYMKVGDVPELGILNGEHGLRWSYVVTTSPEGISTVDTVVYRAGRHGVTARAPIGEQVEFLLELRDFDPKSVLAAAPSVVEFADGYSATVEDGVAAVVNLYTPASLVGIVRNLFTNQSTSFDGKYSAVALVSSRIGALTVFPGRQVKSVR